jgi:hypothetical protein
MRDSRQVNISAKAVCERVDPFAHRALSTSAFRPISFLAEMLTG